MSFILLGVLNSQAGGAAQYYWAYKYEEGNLTINQHITEDLSGNIFWSSGGNYPYPNRNISFGADGTQRWLRQVTQGGTPVAKFFAGSPQASDSSGNFYTANYELSNNYGHIYKYDNSGSLIWQRQLDESTLNIGQIAVDSSDNVFVCGGSSDGTTWRGYLLKLNSDGTINWQKEIGSGNNDYILAIDFDSSGNIYALMRENSSWSGTAATIVKYNSSGVVQWQKYFEAGSSVLANTIRVAPSGNIYICGSVDYSPSSVTWGLLAKFDSSGNHQWNKKLYSNYNNLSVCRGVDIDSDENVYVSVSGFPVDVSREENAIYKFDSSGTSQWIRSFQSTVNRTIYQSIGRGNLKIHSSGVLLVAHSNTFGFEGNQIWSLPLDGSLTGSSLHGLKWEVCTDFFIDYYSEGVATSTLGVGTSGVTSSSGITTEAAYSPATTHSTTF